MNLQIDSFIWRYVRERQISTMDSNFKLSGTGFYCTLINFQLNNKANLVLFPRGKCLVDMPRNTLSSVYMDSYVTHQGIPCRCSLRISLLMFAEVFYWFKFNFIRVWILLILFMIKRYFISLFRILIKGHLNGPISSNFRLIHLSEDTS